MRTLALETSSSTASIAVLEDSCLVAELDLGQVLRTAQSLAPALRSILQEANWEPRDVQLIAVTGGPGSFTGLRAGVTCAKVFAYVTGAEVVAVNTLEVVAAQANVVSDRLWAVMDAQRQQVFVAQFAFTGDTDLRLILATQIVDNDVWLQRLVTGDSVTGMGLVKLAKRLPSDIEVVAEEAWTLQAAMLGRLALAKYQSGERSDFWKLTPQYFRKSAAEETFDQGLLK
ncbi:MAG: tRNA (adenosine(37)-N6)-threonylcarbamoyltransferase complex dimerization subunit type 1 TsaB [Planctomycetota bacterium]|nr:tRNA (adenosine(37)-N6)-threonylcarbamoyltransferase complex dimerization subunit type 1 TsaB [Planctomycetota bacterium]